MGDFPVLVFNGTVSLADALLVQFHVQGLVFDFFAQRLVLTIVTHIVQLLAILFDRGFAGFDIGFTRGNVRIQLPYLSVYFFNTGRQAFYLVLQVLYFQRKLSAQRLDFVDFGKHGLQLVQILQLFFNRQVRRIFLHVFCHSAYYKYFMGFVSTAVM